MGQTIAEKIIGSVASTGDVHPGNIVWVKPDRIGAWNLGGPLDSSDSTCPDVEAIVGAKRFKYPERHIVALDHWYPDTTNEDILFKRDLRSWAGKYGIPLLESNTNNALQSVVEMGLVLPGMFYAHHDTEVVLLGGIGAFAVGTMPLLELYVTGQTWLEVPHSLRFHISGKLPDGVLSRDIMHMIVSSIGYDGASYCVMEFTGPTVESMDVDGRMTMCSMSLHANAKSAIVNPDETTIAYMRQFTSHPFEVITSDEDANYRDSFYFDVSNLEPYVAEPPNVFHTRPLRQVEGVPVQQGLIGTCGGGRMEDLRAAARVLKGRKVNPDFRLYIVPATPANFNRADEEGLLRTLVDSGAFISYPSCNFCYGQAGYLPAGQAAITTNTLNIPGRMGSMEADIYLANAYAIAAASIEGRIVDPRNYL